MRINWEVLNQEARLSRIAFFTSPSSALTLISGPLLCLMAVSGSLSPWPVSVQTTRLPSAILPLRMSCSAPASDLADDERRGTGGLIADHDRTVVDDAVVGVFAVTHPVGGDIAGVADRQIMIVRCRTQFLDDLERRGLLALQAIGVERVHDGSRRHVRDLFHQLHADVEVALNLDDHRTVDHGLRQLAGWRLAFPA